MLARQAIKALSGSKKTLSIMSAHPTHSNIINTLRRLHSKNSPPSVPLMPSLSSSELKRISELFGISEKKVEIIRNKSNDEQEFTNNLNSDTQAMYASTLDGGETIGIIHEFSNPGTHDG